MGWIIMSIVGVASTSYAAATSLFRNDSILGWAVFTCLALFNAAILADQIKWFGRGKA